MNPPQTADPVTLMAANNRDVLRHYLAPEMLENLAQRLAEDGYTLFRMFTPPLSPIDGTGA